MLAHNGAALQGFQIALFIEQALELAFLILHQQVPPVLILHLQLLLGLQVHVLRTLPDVVRI